MEYRIKITTQRNGVKKYYVEENPTYALDVFILFIKQMFNSNYTTEVECASLEKAKIKLAELREKEISNPTEVVETEYIYE